MPTYKINYSGGKARVVNVNKLPNKTTLQSLDRVYLGQPFVNVVSKFQDTRGLDTVYLGQPFYGHTDGYSISNIRSGIDYHPDVDAWLDRVSSNGGTVSSSTIVALTNFCNSVDNAGLRNKFYRLNLFCGNNLAAALVPLYTGPNRYDKPQYGSSTDINYNFIESNYNETGSSAGLTSSGGDPAQINVGTQYIDTTLKASEIIPIGQPTNNMHLAGTISCTALSNAGQIIFYNTLAYVDIYSLTVQLLNGYANIRGMIGSQSINSQIVPQFTGLVSPAQHIMTSRISSNDARNYQSGTQSGSTNITPISTTNSSTLPFLLFRQSQGYYSNMRLTDYSIGLGLTSSEALAYYNILQTFQTALNRNV